MNNNGLNLLRYFRDLKLNAYLLTFENDGVGFSSHFSNAACVQLRSKYLPQTQKQWGKGELESGLRSFSFQAHLLWG